MPKLDFSGKKQLYSQLYDILFQDIVNEVYAVGDLIPSETELMSEYGVSRATARRAMEMLANNGMIQKQRGHGSEVISNLPTGTPRHVASYVKKRLTDKVTPEKRTISQGVVPADALVSARLGIAEGVPTCRFDRVRYSGDMPFYLEVIHVEEAYLPQAAERDFSQESWRAFLANECRIRWSRASQSIYAVVADASQAELLQVEEGSPLIYIERVSYDAAGVPRELVQSHYRADLYHLEIELSA